MHVSVFFHGPTVEKGWFIDLLNRSDKILFERSRVREEAQLVILELGVGWTKPQDNDNQVTIYWSGENNDWTEMEKNEKFYDIHSGFALNEHVASSSYTRMPYFMLEYFDASKCWLYPDLESQLETKPERSRLEWNTRTLNMTFLASHLSYPRAEMVALFEKSIGKIDCNGECGGSERATSKLFAPVELQNISNPSKHSFLKLSKFNLCPENSIGYGYTSEKLFDALFAGAIPIYWPSPAYNSFETWLVNPKRVLFYEESSILKQISSLLNNHGVQVAFFEEPIIQKSARKSAEYICNSFVAKVESALLHLNYIRNQDKFFVMCGKRIQNSKSQEGQDLFIAHTFFPGVCNGTFLEVGAADGVTNSNTYSLEVDLGWRGILIEASPRSYVSLTSVKERNNSIKINGGIGPKKAKTTFIEIDGPQAQLSTVKAFASTAHLDRIEREFSAETGKKREVHIEIKPLSVWIKENGFNRINYLSLDVEGAEYLALQTIDFSTIEIDVISVEINGNGDKIKNKLESNQFRLYKATENLDYIFCHERICPRGNLEQISM